METDFKRRATDELVLQAGTNDTKRTRRRCEETTEPLAVLCWGPIFP
jgi:hypothetical protein